MTKAEYAEYLRSDHWAEVRRRYRKVRPWKCDRCDSSEKSLDLHHRTYKRLGRERLDDLVPLCRTCHQDIHGILVDGKVVRFPEDWRLSARAARARVLSSGKRRVRGAVSGKSKAKGKRRR